MVCLLSVFCTSARTHTHTINELTTNNLKCIWTSPVHVYAYRFCRQHVLATRNRINIFYVWRDDQFIQPHIHTLSTTLLVRAWVSIEFKACVKFLSSNCLHRKEQFVSTKTFQRYELAEVFPLRSLTLYQIHISIYLSLFVFGSLPKSQ